MRGIKIDVPPKPTGPNDAAVRKLCARLLFEEVMETIEGLGVEVFVDDRSINAHGDDPKHDFSVKSSFANMVETVDGCLDTRVVATYTLSIFGVADELLQQEVDNNNTLKFSQGHYIDKGGKLIKPKNHPKPRIKYLLAEQGAHV